eukprot:gene15257-1851_t
MPFADFGIVCFIARLLAPFFYSAAENGTPLVSQQHVSLAHAASTSIESCVVGINNEGHDRQPPYVGPTNKSTHTANGNATASAQLAEAGKLMSRLETNQLDSKTTNFWIDWINNNPPELVKGVAKTLGPLLPKPSAAADPTPPVAPTPSAVADQRAAAQHHDPPPAVAEPAAAGEKPKHAAAAAPSSRSSTASPPTPRTPRAVAPPKQQQYEQPTGRRPLQTQTGQQRRAAAAAPPTARAPPARDVRMIITTAADPNLQGKGKGKGKAHPPRRIEQEPAQEEAEEAALRESVQTVDFERLSPAETGCIDFFIHKNCSRGDKCKYSHDIRSPVPPGRPKCGGKRARGERPASAGGSGASRWGKRRGFLTDDEPARPAAAAAADASDDGGEAPRGRFDEADDDLRDDRQESSMPQENVTPVRTSRSRFLLAFPAPIIIAMTLLLYPKPSAAADSQHYVPSAAADTISFDTLPYYVPPPAAADVLLYSKFQPTVAAADADEFQFPLYNHACPEYYSPSAAADYIATQSAAAEHLDYMYHARFPPSATANNDTHDCALP